MDPSEQERLWGLTIQEKVEAAKGVLHEALERFGVDGMAVAITGGKDSTTGLWLMRQVCRERGCRLPVCMFIDEGDVFPEIEEFVGHLRALWSLDIAFLRNDDVMAQVRGLEEPVPVAALNAANRQALEEMGFLEPEFPFLPDSTVCNHLMKTLPMREFIVGRGLQALATAIRWDEIEAREAEAFFSERTNPPHVRVHPLLHFRERDIWIVIFMYDIPFNRLYKLGYRSLGARCATRRASDIPAWMQDLDNTPERVGRGREKEAVMDQLRSLGYM